MKRVQYLRYGGPEELRLKDGARWPGPGPRGIPGSGGGGIANPMDGKIRRGEMKAMSGFGFPRGLGYDFAGVVEAVGPGVERLEAGDEVFGGISIPEAGAFADYVVADEKNVWLKPFAVGLVEAGRSPGHHRRA